MTKIYVNSRGEMPHKRAPGAGRKRIPTRFKKCGKLWPMRGMADVCQHGK